MAEEQGAHEQAAGDDAALKSLIANAIKGRKTSLWPMLAAPLQLPPPGDWRIWLMLAGRGFGKTRAGAEWVHAMAQRAAGQRIALVGSTAADVRNVMVEGESGLLAIARRTRLRWEPGRALLRWPNGSMARGFSAAAAHRLRGPQHHLAWCDELATWRNAEATWDNLELGLRLGSKGRIAVTTTPRVTPLLRRLRGRPDCWLSEGKTADNIHLPPDFIAAMTRELGGTRRGLEELEGLWLDDAEDALWTRAMLEQCRRDTAPRAEALVRTVIGVDPPAGIGGAACGIIVAATDRLGKGWVLADASLSGASPQRWAQRVADTLAHWNADRVVVEVNQGGAMVEQVLRAVDPEIPLRCVHALHSKAMRAEPVAALYETGRVHHHGVFRALEDELCGMIAGGRYQGPGKSPDRADALVWALTELMLKRQALPQVKIL